MLGFSLVRLPHHSVFVSTCISNTLLILTHANFPPKDRFLREPLIPVFDIDVPTWSLIRELIEGAKLRPNHIVI